jgi:hypothetical protein
MVIKAATVEVRETSGGSNPARDGRGRTGSGVNDYFFAVVDEMGALNAKTQKPETSGFFLTE